MKKINLTVIIVIAVFGFSSLFVEASDITKVEVMPDAVGWDLDSAIFLKETSICRVVHKKVDASGNTLKHVKTILRDVTDNPDTVEVDETLTEFTDLVVDINSGTPFMQAINNAVKTKRGI